MNSNTRIKIRVPKSLYESVKNELKKEGTQYKESGQYYAERAVKGLEEDKQMNESDVFNTIMQGLQEVPAMYELLRQKAQMAPNEFNVLASGIGTILGVGGTLGAAVIKQLRDKMKAEKGNMQSEQPSPMAEKKKIEDPKVQALAEAIKKVMQEKKKKKADAEKKKKEEEAEKKKKEAAMAKKKEAAKKK
jgi:hypothetical protein